MDAQEQFRKAHPFAPSGWEPPKSAAPQQDNFEKAHPFAPSGWAPQKVAPDPTNPIDVAVDKYLKDHQKVSGPLRQFHTTSGYQNLDIFLARLNRVEAMIDGATIGATCNASTSTITVTLNWGA